MENNISCKIIMIGSVRIKIFDGIVRTLIEVRHGPDSKKNIIYLGTFDPNGCKHKIEGGVMKINKRVIVMITDRRFSGSYTLLGTTVTGAIVTASTSMLEEDLTKLWYIRLEHMSEKRMTLLSKRCLLYG